MCCESPNPFYGPLRKNYWSSVGTWGLFHSWHLTLFFFWPRKSESMEVKQTRHWIHIEMLVVQLYLTLCDLMDWGSPGSSVHGILQARILEWVAIPFSRRSSQTRDWTQVSSIAGRLFTFIQISHEAGHVVSYSHLLKNFPVCCDPHSQRLWCSE